MCRAKDGSIKVNIAESITSGADGTTSATGLCGLVLIGVGILIMLVLVGFYFFNIHEAQNIKEFLDIDIIVMSLGTTLIGGRKIIGMLGNNRNINVVKAVSEAMEEYKKEEQEKIDKIKSLND